MKFSTFLTILNIFEPKWVLLLMGHLLMGWIEWGNMPYLPKSHARLLGYINEEDHVAKSKLAKIPNINIES